jgi:phosphohistidine phosphatase SixA
MRRWLLLVAAVAIACQQAPPLADPALADDLRDGGHVIALRHTATDRSSPEPDPSDVVDCSRQRNLSTQGREDAEELGQAFAANGILVDVVLTGLHCRAIDTAELAFGRAEPTPDLLHLPVAPADEQDDLVAALRALLATPPAEGANTVLVTHASNIEEATGEVVDEGEAIVTTPDGEGGFTVAGRIPPPGTSLD